MKFTAEKSDLAKVLLGLKGIADKRNTIPILSNVLLTAADGILRLQVTDLDLEVTDSISVEVEQPGEITVHVGLFADIVRNMPSGSQIKVDTSDDGATVAVTTGRSKFKLQALPASDFPSILAGKFTHSFSLAGAELARLLARTSFAISTEETRYYLNGAFLSASDTALIAVATDGHRLGVAEVLLPAGAEGMPGIIIPRKTVHELAKLADIETVSIELSDAKVRFTIGPVVMTSKLIDGTFPDYRRVIPMGNAKELTVERAVLAGAVDRVSTISTEKGHRMKFGIKEGELELTVSSADTGIANEALSVIYADEPLEMGFNSKYVAELMTAIR